VDVVAAFLLLEVRGGGAADVESAVQVHLEHRVPFVHAHLVEEAVAQDTCVVDHHVDAAKAVDGRLDDAGCACGVRHAVGIGRCLTAHGFDFVHHFLCGACVLAFAGDGRADVVDHHLGTFARHGQRDVAANATTCAGDHDDFVFYQSGFAHFFSFRSWGERLAGQRHPTGG
jgi:hypothetical protein